MDKNARIAECIAACNETGTKPTQANIILRSLFTTGGTITTEDMKGIPAFYSVDGSREAFTLATLIEDNSEGNGAQPLSAEDIAAIKALKVGESYAPGMGAEIKRTV